jgi:hypothetical protein
MQHKFNLGYEALKVAARFAFLTVLSLLRSAILACVPVLVGGDMGWYEL